MELETLSSLMIISKDIQGRLGLNVPPKEVREFNRSYEIFPLIKIIQIWMVVNEWIRHYREYI